MSLDSIAQILFAYIKERNGIENSNLTHKERFFQKRLERNPKFIEAEESRFQERLRQWEAYQAETFSEYYPDCNPNSVQF